MRSMWKGFMTFGLVTIPVRLYSAVESGSDVKFNLLHAKDRGRIRYRRTCEVCGQEIEWKDTVKGYEYAEGEYVEMTDEDFAKADIGASQSIEIKDFVDAREIDTKYFEHPYYPEPQKGGEKPYALLREALRRTGRSGVAKVVFRSREQLACVRPDADGVILLEVMRFADEVRAPAELKVPGDTGIEEREMDLARTLIDHMTAPFDISSYHDEYREKIDGILREKVAGAEPAARGQVPTPTKVVDLMKVLQRSLEERTRQAAAEGRPAGVPAGRGEKRRVSADDGGEALRRVAGGGRGRRK